MRGFSRKNACSQFIAGVWDHVSEPCDHIRFYLFESVGDDTLALIKVKAAEICRFISAMSKGAKGSMAMA